MKHDQPLALFPEGTVGDGGTLLPFKPSLLSAVAPPPAGVTLRPVAIDYHGQAPVLGWAPGEHGLDNALAHPRAQGAPAGDGAAACAARPLPRPQDHRPRRP